jgi:hypothetical protein
MESIEIEPYQINTSIHHIKIFIDNFQLNQLDCWCSVYEYDETDRLLNVHRVYIEPELYQDWGVLDSYIIDIVLDKLGYERKREPVIHF